MNNNPIGIFDSGMGGLTVRAEIARALPAESLVYFGDGLNVPYGPRPKEEIIKFVDEAVEILLNQKSIKLLVVACNAATGAAIDFLRAKYDIPIIGLEPAVKPAATTTRSGTIGILATAAAFRGELYRATAAKFRRQVEILETVGEGFVELVERNLETTPQAIETIKKALEPMLEKGADRIVLGCTHYPFLIEPIQKIIGERQVEVLDSGAAIARRVKQLLMENDLLAEPENASTNASTNAPRHEFLSFAGDDYAVRLVAKSECAAKLRS